MIWGGWSLPARSKTPPSPNHFSDIVSRFGIGFGTLDASPFFGHRRLSCAFVGRRSMQAAGDDAPLGPKDRPSGDASILTGLGPSGGGTTTADVSAPRDASPARAASDRLNNFVPPAASQTQSSSPLGDAASAVSGARPCSGNARPRWRASDASPRPSHATRLGRFDPASTSSSVSTTDRRARASAQGAPSSREHSSGCRPWPSRKSQALTRSS
mmetsp:Transcript_18457/g.64080  ORF Transcript_18457/g.64080 Transcript_18457/m.64080 type:complete len:214 (+) Transcript_18457:767-1408(+)